MIVIGIDPGYDRLGIAVAEKVGGQDILRFSTCLLTNRQDSFAERLLMAANEAEKVFKDWPGAEVALEEVFFSQNKNTALKVAEVRGIINYLAAKNNLPVYHYSPQAVKLAVAGSGNAGKDQVTAMVTRLVSFPKLPKYDDEYDAVAVALPPLNPPAALRP